MSADFVDLHAHLMPGVDDGAATIQDSLEAVRRLRAQGVARIVATPHFNASLLRQEEAKARRIVELDTAWERLRDATSSLNDIEIERGAEIALDDPSIGGIPESLCLGGSSFVLVEFAFMRVPPNGPEGLARIARTGRVPVLAHPERYGGVRDLLVEAQAWKRAGARLQVNMGSILGFYGEAAGASAEILLREGLADYIASDYHSRGSPPHNRAAGVLDRLVGRDNRRLLCRDNPRRLLEGLEPLGLDADMPRAAGWWRRLVDAVFG